MPIHVTNTCLPFSLKHPTETTHRRGHTTHLNTLLYDLLGDDKPATTIIRRLFPLPPIVEMNKVGVPYGEGERRKNTDNRGEVGNNALDGIAILMCDMVPKREGRVLESKC